MFTALALRLQTEGRLLVRTSVRWFAKIYGFKDKYPELYNHVHKDSLALFDKPFVGSKQMVKWVCDKGPDHVWESELGKKISSYNHAHKCKSVGRMISLVTCLYCLGRKVSVTNSLATKFPEIANEWDYEKNEGITPKDVTYGSSKLYWWTCPNDPSHHYLASCNDRTYSHRTCPYCNGMELCATNSLAVKYPEIARQWDAEKNGSLTPDQILPSYTGKVWWKCDNHPNHSWECAVNLRVRLHWGICLSLVTSRMSLLQSSPLRRSESGCVVP